MKYDDLNYFKMFSLSITQIGHLLLFGFANFVFYTLITEYFCHTENSINMDYIGTIARIMFNLLIFHCICSFMAKHHFESVIQNHLINEELVVNNFFYHLFFALTTIAFTFLFGIKDKTLELMFPNDKLLQWDFNLILYWCTGFISIIFLYFKQLKEKWKNYIFEKKIECTDTNNKHE